jgi:hypothetical protein
MKATHVAPTLAAAAAAVFGLAGPAHADVMPPPYIGPTPPTIDCTDPTQTPCRAVVVVDQTIATAPDANSTFTPLTSTTTKTTLGDHVLNGTAINVGWTGCMAVDTSIALQNDYFIYTETLYRYHQHLDWCGSGTGSVVKPNHYDYVTEVSGLVYQVGPQITDNAVYYDAWGGYPKSGYNAFTQRRMDNCAFNVGCVKSTYPWVRNIGFADGAWWNDAGIR